MKLPYRTPEAIVVILIIITVIMGVYLFGATHAFNNFLTGQDNLWLHIVGL